MRRLGAAVVLVLAGTGAAVLPPAVPPARAAVECAPVTPAQVRYGGALLEATVPVGEDACFELPGDADDAYVVGLPQGAQHVVSLRVEDASGRAVCTTVSFDWPLCALDGAAPFRLVVPTSHGAAPPGTPVTVGARALRVTSDTGCPAIAAQPFGSAAQLTGTTVNDFRCYTFALPDGAYPALTLRGPSGVMGKLIDPAGGQVCLDGIYRGCTPPSGVSAGTLVVGGPGYSATLHDLASSAGCRPGPAATWGSAPAAGRWRDRTQVDCLLLSGSAGEVVVPTVESDSGLTSRVVSGDGEPGCVAETQCRLQGPAPYRLLVFGSDAASSPPADYRALAPSLAAGSGCPVLTPRPYGAAATDRHRGIGCRQLDVQPGQRLLLDVVDLTDDPTFGGALLAADGTQVHLSPSDPYFAPPPGRYSLVADVFDADFVTMLHATGDARGCTPVAADLSTVNRRLPLAGADCFVLDSSAGDRVVPIARTTETAYPPRVLLVDATGAPACTLDEVAGDCTVNGVPPFKAIVGEGAALPYVLTVLDRADPPTCLPLELGSRRGAVVHLSAAEQLTCVTLPDDPAEPGAVRLHAWRLIGTGGVSPANVPAGGACDTRYELFRPVEQYLCHHHSDPAQPLEMLLIGDGHDQYFYVAATPARVTTLDEPGITRVVNAARPRLQGKPLVDRTLRVHPGRWAPPVPDLTYTYRWTVGGKVVKGARGRTLRLRRAHAGKPVRVRVTADTSTLLPGRATTKVVRVRRR